MQKDKKGIDIASRGFHLLPREVLSLDCQIDRGEIVESKFILRLTCTLAVEIDLELVTLKPEYIYLYNVIA